MNLFDKYTPHEMMEMTIRDIKRKQQKKEKEIIAYQSNRSDTIKKRCGMRRNSSGC